MMQGSVKSNVKATRSKAHVCRNEEGQEGFAFKDPLFYGRTLARNNLLRCHLRNGKEQYLH